MKKNSIQILLLRIKGLKNYFDYRVETYKKIDGDRFKSINGYVTHLLKAIDHLGYTPELFFAIDKIGVLERMMIQLENKMNRWANLIEIGDTVCSYRAYVNYLKYMKGSHDMYGNPLSGDAAAAIMVPVFPKRPINILRGVQAIPVRQRAAVR
jgi:hypothetical protein